MSLSVRCKRSCRNLLLIFMLVSFLPSGSSFAQEAPRGKVLIIRGLFTVFSLGLDQLGAKLSDEGYDVQVVPAIWAGVSGDQILNEYLDDSELGPIVLIGHSRGGDLAPVQARKLEEYGISVELMVIIDTVRDQLIPANVKRCVNIYTTNMLGIYSGEPVSRESQRTELLNIHVDDLDGRENAGFINHFNIDSSDWIHDRIVQEVLTASSAAVENSADVVEQAADVEEPARVERPSWRTRFRRGATGRTITLRL